MILISLKFPVPLVHHLDGGRYIATGAISITKDPDEGWVKLGTYRGQLIDKSSIGWYISPGKHGIIQRKNILKKVNPVRQLLPLVRTPPFSWLPAWRSPGPLGI